MALTDRPTAGSARSGRAPLWMAIVVAALVIVAALLAWRLVRSGGRVVLFGDSITFISTGTFDRTLGDDYSLTTDGQSGERTDERVAEARDAAAADPDQVIVNLGTNDILQATSLDTAVSSLEQVGDAFEGARCVHLVTINENLINLEDPQMADRSRQLNQRIHALADRKGWYVVPWAQIVREYDEAGSPEGPLTTDTVHPTEAVGQVKLAHAYEEALARCPVL